MEEFMNTTQAWGKNVSYQLGIGNTTRDRLEAIKCETKALAGSLKKISDAVAGIDSRSNTVCGATLENIVDLLHEYEIRNGKFPISSESIKRALGQAADHNELRRIYEKAHRAEYRERERGRRAEILRAAAQGFKRTTDKFMYGRVALSGDWRPNEKIKMSPINQFYRNVASGHLCGTCMKDVR